MAVIGHAELGIEPVRGTGLGRAVIGGLVLDLEVELDPDRRAGVLDQNCEVRHFADPHGGEGGLKTLLHPGLGHQGAGALHVLLALGYGGIRRWIDRRDRRIVADLCITAEQAGHQAGTIQRQRNGLTHTLISEFGRVGLHMDLTVRRGPQLQHFDVRVIHQALAALHCKLRDDVDLATLKRQKLRLLVVEETELRSGRQHGPAPPVGISYEARADVGCEALYPEWTGAHEGLFKVPGVIGWQDDRVVVSGADIVGEIAVGSVEVERHRQVVDLAGAAQRQNTAEGRKRVRAIFGVGQAVHCGDYVGGTHDTAIVEFHTRAQLERPHVSGAVGRPGQGQHGPHREVG